MKQLGFINIYRSGFFHREGKPGMFNRHPGDIYPTREAAMVDIHPSSHYIDTIPIEWEEEVRVALNAQDSTPIPLSYSRKQWFKGHEDAESSHPLLRGAP